MREITTELDHYVLLPTQHPQIRVEDNGREVTATFAERRWVFPSGDCRLLPVANTTAELLAAYIGKRLFAALGGAAAKIERHARRSRRVRRPDRRLASGELAATASVGKPIAQSTVLTQVRAAFRADMSSGRIARAGRKAIATLLASTSVRHIMSDIHNAAVLLMTLPEEEAGDLMSKLDPKQVEQVSIEIARTRTIAADEQERVIKEFTEANPAMGGRGGGLELAKSLHPKGARQQRGGRTRTTSANRSRPRRSASCGTSTARTC